MKNIYALFISEQITKRRSFVSQLVRFTYPRNFSMFWFTLHSQIAESVAKHALAFAVTDTQSIDK